ncbi:MAG: LPS export ABC transporter permease LptG [Alphaproteobacteria bacterium]|nr:LPS export ABC transporter permease LptG [Alphaproteobacteria bacterium]
MVIAGRIQRYIFRESLSGLLLTLCIIVLAILLVDVVEQLRTIGSRTEIGVATAFQLTLLKTPGLILETLPFAMLVGSIMTFSRFSRRSEIPAIRAAGVSGWRFLGPTIVLALLTGGLMVTVIDPMATRLNQEFETRRSQILNTRSSAAIAASGGVWLSQGDIEATGGAGAGDQSVAEANPDGQAIISARRVVGRAQALEEVTFFYFRPGPGGPTDREFTHRIDARRAVLVPGFWQLEGVVENRFGGDVHRQELLALPTNLQPNTLLSRFASSKTIPFWDLPRFIAETRSAGLEVDQYVLKLHTLLATPFLMVAMALIGAVVCLRLARSGGLSRLIGLGAVLGFILFFATRMAAGLSASGATPPEAAAWCPPLFALFAVLAFIAHAEDG